jgi:hypothetical protein
MLGIPEEKWKALAEQRRSENFFHACRTPGRWLHRAAMHKYAADILYRIGFEASERSIARMLAEIRSGGPKSGARTLEGQELQDHIDQDLLQEYLLLAGYALECLTKGYLLAVLPELVDEKRIDRTITTHDLPGLFHECGVQVTDSELELLKLMTRHIVWGKYTAPLYLRDMPSWIAPEDQAEKSLCISNPFIERRVQVLVDAMYSRMATMLDACHNR